VQKLYVHEIRPNGEASTVGLYYSSEEAKNVVARLRGLPEKHGCRYEITESVSAPAAPTPKHS
jgi:hypothetical protein